MEIYFPFQKVSLVVIVSLLVAVSESSKFDVFVRCGLK